MTSSIPVESEWFLNSSNRPTNETLTDTTTSGQSELEINSNEEIHHTSQVSRTGVSRSEPV